MRAFILLCVLLSLSAVSCKGRRSTHHMRSPDIAIDKLDNRQTEVNVDNTFIIMRKNVHRHKKIHLICRGQEGCLHICDHFNHDNFDHSTCKQLSVSQVIDFWITKISEYKSWEQAHNDLTFIATNKDVANFIKAMDKDGRVMKSLFRIGTSAICPISGNLAVRHSPHASLYLLQTTDPVTEKASDENSNNVAEHTTKIEQTENTAETTQDNSQKNVKTADSKEPSVDPSNTQTSTTTAHDSTMKSKKIIDGSIISFDFPIFFSFIKKCFGVDPVRTFTNLAVEIENRSAFEIAHQVLAEACNNNSACIRLAYCNIDSDLVWNQVDEKYKELGCEYDSFIETIPQTNAPISE